MTLLGGVIGTIEEIVNAETETPRANQSFSKSIPKLQLAWDSTSFGALCKCPRFYEYSIIEGYTREGENDHVKFGWLLHAATELYDKLRAEGEDHESALMKSVKFCLINTWDSKRGRPWASDEPTKTRATLLRSVIWYLDRFRNDHFETLILPDGRPAIEYSFRFQTEVPSIETLPCEDCDESGKSESGDECPTCRGSGIVFSRYLMCGHIDKMIVWNDEGWVTDKKTTRYALDEYFFRQFHPDNQSAIYTIAGLVGAFRPIVGFIIDGIQVLVNSTTFRRQPIPIAPEHSEEFLRDFAITLGQNETYVRENYWPMNRKSCGFGRLQCIYRPVCSADPIIREEILNNFFIRRTWDPLIPR